ncbi:MAG: nicotinamidase [Myxococcales bacterium]|nr:nicotinamidase [Myxococcales bacterium]MCB9642381.1 nicotinamidase [Myxococcales bacterium]
MYAAPSYYEEKQAGEVYVERSWEVAAAARKLKELKVVHPSREDKLRVAAFGIDCQVDFCAPQGALYVKGAVDDMKRTLHWFYRNLSHITSLYFSLDTHNIYQIFHPAWWRDRSGRPPAPLTVIHAAEIEAGNWIATRHPEASLAYCKALESSGRYVLTIWPYHTLRGTTGHALMPALGEAALFHSLVREEPIHFETKGSEPLTESYSVFVPEVTELEGRKLGSFREGLLSTLLSYDRVYVFGQASSHCVRATLLDIKERLEKDAPTQLSKFYVLKDAMSPVPPPPLHPLPDSLNFPHIAEQTLEILGNAGMNIVTTEEDLIG